MPDGKVSLLQLLQSLFAMAITLVVMGAALFVPVGRLDWTRGVTFFAIFIASILIAMIYMWRVNPDIFVARKNISKGTKGWDLVLIPALLGAFLAIMVVAGFDDGRFGWASLPNWLVWIGYLVFFAGFAITAWAQAVNRYFEPGVRIQSDRGHAVISTGPYALVRHPGYIGANLLAVGMALALGSGWAVLPALLVVAILAYRTLREEETLRAELAGYTDYTERVKYRWVPNIW